MSGMRAVWYESVAFGRMLSFVGLETSKEIKVGEGNLEYQGAAVGSVGCQVISKPTAGTYR